MRKSRFTQEQIAMALRQAEAGRPSRRSAGSSGSARRRSFAGRSSTAGWACRSCGSCGSCARRIGGSKGLVADLTLDKTMLQEALAKKMVRPAQRREWLRGREAAYQVSQRRACRALGVSRLDDPLPAAAGPSRRRLRQRLRELAAARVHAGYQQLHVYLRREGLARSITSGCYRLYREEGLVAAAAQAASASPRSSPREGRPIPVAAERALGDGLHARRAGRRDDAAGAHRDRRLHARVRGAA